MATPTDSAGGFLGAAAKQWKAWTSPPGGAVEKQTNGVKEGKGDSEEAWQSVERDEEADGGLVTEEINTQDGKEAQRQHVGDEEVTPGCLGVNLSLRNLVDTGLVMAGLREASKEKEE